MKRDKLLEQAISEAESFLLECRTYNKRINKSYTIKSDPHIYFDTAKTERGILKARSLLLIRKLQEWRKRGNAE